MNQSQRERRAAILTVGTEITTGEIVNGNAASISRRLVDLGIEVALHEVVADDRPEIIAGLIRCAGVAQTIIVTGGLGPTTDDFTRDVIAEWTDCKLIYDEPSWQRIVDRLTTLNVPIAESNKRQCWFPDGARILPNRNGTASGFQLRSKDCELFVLPGPPGEIKVIWDDHIHSELTKRVAEHDRLILKQWHCIGQSESLLGEIVEAAVAGSGLLTGYRSHIPYVTVKIWYRVGDAASVQPWLSKLETAIKSWCVARDDEDLGVELVKAMRTHGTSHILDAATTGFLSERLGPCLRSAGRPAGNSTAPAPLTGMIKITTLAVPQRDRTKDELEAHLRAHLLGQRNEDLTLAAFGIDSDGHWWIGMKRGELVQVAQQKSRFRGWEHLERSQKLVSEIAIKTWLEWLRHP